MTVSVVVTTIIALLGGVSGAYATIYAARKQSRVRAMEQALEAQEKTIEAQQERLRLQDARYQELDCRLAKVERQSEERRLALVGLIEGLTESGICLRAPTCPDRVVPEPARV